MSQQIFEVDVGTLEGGGQILRMSLVLSALLKKPIRIYNIRAGRSTPGLRPQHLAGVRLVRDICNGCLVGDEIGSTEITFFPKNIAGGKFSADPGTAGSVMLLFQVSFPCLLYANAPSELFLRGGTNADMAPQIDHTLMTFKPIAEKMGAKFSCTVIKRGYFPKGGGEVSIKVTPIDSPLQPLTITDPGTLAAIEGRSFVAGVLPIKMAHGMADSAVQFLKRELPSVPMKIERLKEPTHLAEGNGSGIVIVGKTDKGCLLGGSALGKRGLQVEEVGRNAAKELIDDLKSHACVDRYTQDQLIIFMALAKGKSTLQIGVPTLHTKTAIYIAELLTDAKFHLHEKDGCTTIECDGIGMTR